MSKSIGETDGVVWDYVAVCPQGKLWDKGPPEPSFSKAPVIHAIEETRQAIQQSLQGNSK